MIKNVKFDILMSTYNGSKYIEQQIQSLFAQKEYINKIYIRDDGSTDQTIEIIKKCQNVQPNIINLINDNKGNLGPKDSFFSLCKYASSDFIAFCDQDDVWEPSKLRYFSDFINGNNIDGANENALIHCDLEVVDGNLILISPSFWKLMGIDHEDNVLDVSIRNTVTGCACVISKALMHEYKGNSNGFNMHDHFYAAYAALNNSVYRIHLPLIKYRQHENNCIGATLSSPKKSIYKKIATKKITDYPRAIHSKYAYDWDGLSNILNSLICSIKDNQPKNNLIKLQKICHRQPLAKMTALLWMFVFDKSISVNGFRRLFLRPLKINKK